MRIYYENNIETISELNNRTTIVFKNAQKSEKFNLALNPKMFETISLTGMIEKGMRKLRIRKRIGKSCMDLKTIKNTM